MKKRFRNNKSSVSINYDIEKTKELYIPLNTTSLDPYKYKDLKTEDLFQKIYLFFNSDKEVMLLLA